MDDAKKVGPRLQHLAKMIADEYGASVTPLNYKQESSIRRKLRETNNIKDAVRTTIIADVNKIPSIISDLMKTKSATLKEHKPDDNIGYSGYIVNVKMNGITTEIQVNTPEMIFAKERYADAYRILGKETFLRIKRETGMMPGYGHYYYENYRERGGKTLKNKQQVKIDSEKYYSNFRGKKISK